MLQADAGVVTGELFGNLRGILRDTGPDISAEDREPAAPRPTSS